MTSSKSAKSYEEYLQLWPDSVSETLSMLVWIKRVNWIQLDQLLDVYQVPGMKLDTE